MVLYTILSLIVTFFLSVSIIEIAGQIQEEVWWKYVDQDEYYQAMNDRNENFEVGVVYKRLFVQVAYLIGISLLAYGLFYWQKPVNLTEELDGGALFGIYCIAIPGTVLFWSVLSVTVSNLVRNRWIGMGVVLLFWFFSISGKATQFLKNWGPFSYGTCDFGKLTEWRWLGGKVLCVVFAGMMLAFVPKILKKRG